MAEIESSDESDDDQVSRRPVAPRSVSGSKATTPSLIGSNNNSPSLDVMGRPVMAAQPKPMATSSSYQHKMSKEEVCGKSCHVT